MSIISNVVVADTVIDTDTDTFAWLVPTASSSTAQRALLLPSNAGLVLRGASIPAHLAAHLLPHASLNNNDNKPLDGSALTAAAVVRLSFSQTTKQPGCFTIGTDPSACDIVLPAYPLPHQSSSFLTPHASLSSSSSSDVGESVSGSSAPFISRQHCALTFDDAARLVLHDFSARGTAVWFGWESAGDMVDHTWVLGGPPASTSSDPDPDLDPESAAAAAPPAMPTRIVIDIQGARFQLIPNVPLAASDPAAYRAKVESFCAPQSQPPAMPWLVDDPALAAADWVRKSLLSGSPPRVFKHVVVKAHDPVAVQEVYLWNVARPWEPMVRASA
ncbi:hypothetical protein ACCO45_000154 [Purpureocillium lilacinum]|uniref:Uncharacterized protein n=1 Tax=Purpureocillium lilacinum TaxID=33203 RepID=A0ACC4E3B7_PURLI